MSDNGFKKAWVETGQLVAIGGKLGVSELYAIYDNLDIRNIDPLCLPTEDTIMGKPIDRKNAIFALAEKLWGLTPGDWLKKESYWLEKARETTQSTETAGKDKIHDVVSPEILLRLIAAAKLVYEDKYDREVTGEAIIAINLILSEVCAKGRSRMTFTDDQSVYSVLKKGGLMFGLGGGKYLPYPEKALPELFLMLKKNRLCPEVYLR